MTLWWLGCERVIFLVMVFADKCYLSSIVLLLNVCVLFVPFVPYWLRGVAVWMFLIFKNAI